jgi:hypothetical protein
VEKTSSPFSPLEKERKAGRVGQKGGEATSKRERRGEQETGSEILNGVWFLVSLFVTYEL